MSSSPSAVTVQSLENGCYPYNPDLPSSYLMFGYIPSLVAGIIFVVLFSLSGLFHITQVVRTKELWCLLFPVGCIGEVLGWAARLWGRSCPYNLNAYLMQMSCLVLAPNFYTAALYVLLGNLVASFGAETSILSRRLFLWIFISCDFISLVIQAIGGGLASAQAEKVNGNTKPGTDIMVAGILFQTASLTVFFIFAVDFVRRSVGKPNYRDLWCRIIPLAGAAIFSVLCIYMRCIYRAIELLDGWTGPIITTQRYFIALDGAMMLGAVIVFNIFHPGRYLKRLDSSSRGSY